jgi:hypothetical protein
MVRAENSGEIAMRRLDPVRRAMIAGVILFSSAAPAAAPTLGPVIPGKIVILKNGFDKAPAGYVVEERFLSGTAKAWRFAKGETAPQGKIEPNGEAPFTTRLIVVRPADPGKFNGTVLVEWLNVTTGADGSGEWSNMRRELVRGGYAYIGVSAQRVAIDGIGYASVRSPPLKQVDPARYAALQHPGDQYSYDIFSQAGALVGSQTRALLGSLQPKRVLAAGQSQSAMLLTTYANSIDPVARVYDGFLIHSRFRWARGIDATWHGPASAAEEAASAGDRFRRDLRVPVLNFITETDLMFEKDGYLHARQPDEPRLRTWEVAGTAHGDNYSVAGALDDGRASPAVLASIYAPRSEAFGQKLSKPVNAAPQHHYVLEAALVALDRWVATGRAPASKTAIAVRKGKPPSLILDAQGNATGGIRSPWLDVPLMRLSGTASTGESLGIYFGSSEPLGRETLARLYPRGKPDYLAKFTRALDAAIARGDILRTDRAEIVAMAGAMYP